MSVAATVIPVFILMICLVLVIPVVMGVYVYRDASRRGMNAALWTVICLLAPGFIGLIIYLIVRSEHSDLRCSSCSRPVKASFQVCPYCGTPLKEHCPNCGYSLEVDWIKCPGCAQSIPEELRRSEPSSSNGDKGIRRLLLAVILIPLSLCICLSVAVCGLFAFSNSYSSSSSIFMSEIDRDSFSDDVIEWVDECDTSGPGFYVLRGEDRAYSDSEDITTALLLYCNNGYAVANIDSYFGGWFTDDTAEFQCVPGGGDSDTILAYYEYTGNKPCRAKVLADGKKSDVSVTETDIIAFDDLYSFNSNEACINVYVDEGALEVYSVECSYYSHGDLVSSEGGALADESSAAGFDFDFFYDIYQYAALTDVTVCAYDRDGNQLACVELDIEDSKSWRVVIAADESGIIVSKVY